MKLSELPEGWLRAKLLDVIEPRGEKALPSELPDLPFLGMDHVEAQTTRILGSVPASSMKSSAARFFAGDVLYGRLRPYLNKVAQPNFHGLASAEFIVFPDTELLHSKFLRFRLNAADFVSFASHLNEGDRPRVNFDQIGEFELLVPPPAEQHRIVAKIEELFSELDHGVASLKTAREQLKVYRQSLLKNAFEGKLTATWRAAHRDQLETATALQQSIAREREARYQQQLTDWQTQGGPKPKTPKPLPPLTAEELAELPELPAGWGWVSLEVLISGVDQGWSPKCEGRRADENEWAVIKTTAIQHGRFDGLENKVLPPGLVPRTQHELQPGDILVTRAGPRVRVGVCCLVRSVKPKLMNCDKAYRIRALASLCSPQFLESVLNSPRVLDVLERIKSGINDSGVNLNQGAFLGLAIPFCALSEQQAVVQELESKLSEADQLDQTLATALQQAEALRQSILKKAFCGQLVPQDQDDEPATALLARIRADKANGITKAVKRGRVG